MNIFSVLKLGLGLAFFLFGMHVMSTNLERMSGGKLEHALKKMTANPIAALALGAGITIAIQSSSASTVMLVGLVNSGIMSFTQTIHVIFGANIGTTLTAWILGLSGISSENLVIQMLKPENFSPIIALIGIFMLMLSKKDKRKSIGTIFVGFAILMYGMEFMKEAVSPLADTPEFSDLLVKFNNPILGVVIGALFTALIQSSAASVGILQALAMTGSITYAMAIPIVMGQNIGTCITSIISCIGTNTNAKRVAAIHLSLNVIGTIICISIYGVADLIFDLTFSNMTVDGFSIALIHTAFNVIITLVLMPFSKWILKFVEFIVKDKSDINNKHDQHVFKLDNLLLRSPSVAVSECDAWTTRMAKLAHETLLDAMTLFDQYDESVAERIIENEEKIDGLEDALGSYLVKLSAEALSTEDSRKISKMLHTIGDFERLGDHALNLYKAAKEIHEKGESFSEDAQKELNKIRSALTKILDITFESYKNRDPILAGNVEPLEQVIDALNAEIKDNHIARLQKGSCTIELGFILSDILMNYQRISDHCSNIAVSIIELVHGSYDTHQYLSSMKHGNDEFQKIYSSYLEEYKL